MGDAERFVAEHADLVRRTAFAIAKENGLSTDVDDLIGWGVEGLLTARERFDASKGVPFEAFAYYRVRGAILDGVRLLSDLPPQVHRLSRQAALADAHLEDLVTERAASGEPLDDDGLMLAARSTRSSPS